MHAPKLQIQSAKGRARTYPLAKASACNCHGWKGKWLFFYVTFFTWVFFSHFPLFQYKLSENVYLRKHIQTLYLVFSDCSPFELVCSHTYIILSILQWCFVFQLWAQLDSGGCVTVMFSGKVSWKWQCVLGCGRMCFSCTCHVYMPSTDRHMYLGRHLFHFSFISISFHRPFSSLMLCIHY